MWRGGNAASIKRQLDELPGFQRLQNIQEARCKALDRLHPVVERDQHDNSDWKRCILLVGQVLVESDQNIEATTLHGSQQFTIEQTSETRCLRCADKMTCDGKPKRPWHGLVKQHPHLRSVGRQRQATGFQHINCDFAVDRRKLIQKLVQ